MVDQGWSLNETKEGIAGYFPMLLWTSTRRSTHCKGQSHFKEIRPKSVKSMDAAAQKAIVIARVIRFVIPGRIGLWRYRARLACDRVIVVGFFPRSR